MTAVDSFLNTESSQEVGTLEIISNCYFIEKQALNVWPLLTELLILGA